MIPLLPLVANIAALAIYDAGMGQWYSGERGWLESTIHPTRVLCMGVFPLVVVAQMAIVAMMTAEGVQTSNAGEHQIAISRQGTLNVISSIGMGICWLVFDSWLQNGHFPRD